MVCNLGEHWSASLAQVRGGDVVTIAQDRSRAGRDLDTMLVGDFRTHAGDRFEPRQLADFVRGLKHGLAEQPEVTAQLDRSVAPYQLTQDRLVRLAEPGLRWVVASCRSLLARAAAGVGDTGLLGHRSIAPGATLAHVAAVVVIGGHARLPGVEWIVADGLGRPVAIADEPSLALIRGGVRWVAAAPTRRVVADHPRWRVEPLVWEVPGGRGRLVRWSVAPGATYRRGAIVAQVRTPDERVFDLTAPDDGVLLSAGARVGELVGPTLMASSKRPTSLLAGDQPGKRQVLAATGEWLLTPDRDLLVECAATARQVRLWSIADGVLVREFEPDLPDAETHQGRVFVNPGGRLSLVAWNPSGLFSVFDVSSGRRTATFRDSNTPLNVMVNENEWRLTAEAEDAGSAGRYRRQVVTVWDLGTGQRLEKVTDDRQHHLLGYRDRSAVDSFGEHAFSPDGRLKAIPVRSARGATGIALQEAASDQEVFRAEYPPSAWVRMAFSKDSRLLLSNHQSGQQSLVDVWEL
jgi:molecular chaperone DnaK